MVTPTNKTIWNDIIVNPDGTLFIEFTANMLADSGTGIAEINIIDHNDIALLSSYQFYILIEKSVVQDEKIKGSDEYNSLTNMYIKISNTDALVTENEKTRQAYESERISNENIRKSNEDIRVSAESKRVEAEKGRVSAESKRVTSEQGRTDAESKRVTSEQSRTDAESKRVEAEKGRVSAESKRVTSEQGRTDAESKRVEAEKIRESDCAAVIKDVETILANINTNLWEAIYPVGAIYISTSSTSPATLFGGTWEQIKDRFLIGAGNTYAAGATGGEASHTLTIDEMPSHGHTFTGSSATTSSDGEHTHTYSATTSSDGEHIHTYSGNTGYVSSDHAHSAWTDAQGAHAHNVGIIGTASSGSNQWRPCSTGEASDWRGTTVAGAHGHNVGVGGISANHIHGFSGTTSGVSTNHTHSISGTTSGVSANHTHTSVAKGSNSNTGGGKTHNNIPPYLAVYMWKRTK